jgi:hypothetical protein
METITLDEAVNVIKNPREGSSTQPYRRDKSLKRTSTGPSSKKSKPSSSTASSDSTG